MSRKHPIAMIKHETKLGVAVHVVQHNVKQWKPNMYTFYIRYTSMYIVDMTCSLLKNRPNHESVTQITGLWKWGPVQVMPTRLTCKPSNVSTYVYSISYSYWETDLIIKMWCKSLDSENEVKWYQPDWHAPSNVSTYQIYQFTYPL